MADRIADLVGEFTRTRNGMFEFIDAMPDHLMAYKPVPEVFSFAGQMIHIASTIYRFAGGTVAVELPPEAQPIDEASSKAKLLEYVGASFDFMIRAIQTLQPEALDETVPFHKWKMTRSVMMAKALEHHAHHRGQTVIYFRLNGLQPPPERLF